MMSRRADESKGRIRQAIGAVTRDERLRRAGKIDQAVVEVKQMVEKVVDTTQDPAKVKHTPQIGL
jgi:uncharacterized protein YjbJ (UPF0337 family)